MAVHHSSLQYKMGHPSSAVLHSMTASWKHASARTADGLGWGCLGAGPGLAACTGGALGSAAGYQVGRAAGQAATCHTCVPPHFHGGIHLLLLLLGHGLHEKGSHTG